MNTMNEIKATLIAGLTWLYQHGKISFTSYAIAVAAVYLMPNPVYQ